MRRKATVLAALALCVSLCTAVGAAEPEETGQLEEGEWKAQPLQQGEITSPPPVELLPVEVIASEDDIAYRLEKIYELGAEEDPAQIPTEGFEREGHKYVFLDLLKEDRRETDTKEHTEAVTRNTKTKDTEAILKELPATVEYNGEDGYTGILTLDTSSVQVEAAGYGSRSYDVSATRTYPNLSDADTSLIPKTVEENGNTLQLADIAWQTAAADQMTGQDLAMRYTAVATYTGKASSRYATGYVVTANYTGDVSKTTSDVIVYTAVFSATKEEEKPPYLALIGIPAGVLLGGAGTAAGIAGYKKYKKKGLKR